MKQNPECMACASTYTVYVQDVIGNRTRDLFPQFVCLDCRSFFHRSGYRESEEIMRRDFEILFGDREHHRRLMSQLFLEIVTRYPAINTVLEIGHGAGMFMQACHDYGRKPFGFEVNPHCHAFVRNDLGLPCHLGLFDESHDRAYDLIASIQVFEHLENPRQLFKTMTEKLNKDGLVYISVPVLERELWPFLWTAGTSPAHTMPDPFFDNDVHISHFSIEGLIAMGRSYGAKTADYFVSKDVVDASPGSYQGVLFRF